MCNAAIEERRARDLECSTPDTPDDDDHHDEHDDDEH